MNRVIPCVLMRAGTSRGPFFLREWLPADDTARDEAHHAVLPGTVISSSVVGRTGVHAISKETNP